MSASREKRLRREIRDAEANSDTVKKKKKQRKPMTQAKAKKLRSAIGSAIAIVLVLVFIGLIFVNSGFVQTHGTAVTVGSHKVTPVEFDYFYHDTYYNIYSQYASSGLWSYMVDTTKPIESQSCTMGEDGETWKEYLTRTAMDSAKRVYALYDAAQEAGYTLDEDAQSTIDTTRDNLSTYASSAGYKKADDYLEANYGKGADVDSYIQYLTVQQIASSYAQEKTDSFTYTDDELRTYYDENKQDFDKITYRLFNVATQNDDTDAAKSTADSMNADLTGTEESFIKAAQDYAPEDSAESYKDESYTLRSNQGYSSISSDYADWLFSDSRTAGDHEVFATSSGYSVVMFVSRDDNNYNTVNVRHILVKVATSGDNSTSTDADWADCKEKIDEIQKEWEATDQTEDDFAALATEKSEDTGSASNGGLYEGVYKGQMVTEFNDWCFDASRKVGDTAIIKTSYGYHLMYFSGTGDLYWKTLADTSKRNADYTAWYDDFSASYEAKKSTMGLWFTNKELAQLSGSTRTTAAN